MTDASIWDSIKNDARSIRIADAVVLRAEPAPASFSLRIDPYENAQQQYESQNDKAHADHHGLKKKRGFSEALYRLRLYDVVKPQVDGQGGP